MHRLQVLNHGDRNVQALLRKIDWKVMLWGKYAPCLINQLALNFFLPRLAAISFSALNLDRNNLSQANTDNFLPDLGMTTDGEPVPRIASLAVVEHVVQISIWGTPCFDYRSLLPSFPLNSSPNESVPLPPRSTRSNSHSLTFIAGPGSVDSDPNVRMVDSNPGTILAYGPFVFPRFPSSTWVRRSLLSRNFLSDTAAFLA